MIIGIPKEIKPQEGRVALTPSAIERLSQAGHTLLIEKGAGIKAGFSDRAFSQAGAKLIPNAKEIWKKSDLIVKVKEPLPKEYSFFRPGLLLFTFLHLASQTALINALKKNKVSAIGYETITDDQNHLPLLKPMSQIAGKLAVLIGAEYLRTDHGKKGILLSRVEGTRQGRITILGAGNAGLAALEVAMGIGAEVVLIDRDEKKLEQIKKERGSFGQTHHSLISLGTLTTHLYEEKILSNLLIETDLLIGAVLIPGAKAPKLVNRKMISQMHSGSVIVDISVDQGGCIETTKPTTHASPVFTYKNIIHYGVTNMPSLVARSATEALCHKIFPYVLRIANEGLKALEEDRNFLKGLQVHQGNLLI